MEIRTRDCFVVITWIIQQVKTLKKEPIKASLLATGLNLCFYQIHPDWHLIPRPAFEDTPCSFLLDSTPLFEEKRDIASQALISNIREPSLQDRPCAGTGLTAYVSLYNYRRSGERR